MSEPELELKEERSDRNWSKKNKGKLPSWKSKPCNV